MRYANDKPSIKQAICGFFVQVMTLWQSVFSDKGVLTMLLIAPIIYGFFYPWPYRNEVVRQVPVAIVDYDHSPLSQKLINHAAINPRIQPTVIYSEDKLKPLMWQQDIAGYLIIPYGLQKRVLNGQSAKVSVMANGNYFMLNKQVQTGFMEVVGTLSAKIEIQKSIAQGQDLTLASQNFNAVNLTVNPLYNTTEGYGSYVVPPVSLLILQQMYLMGTAMLVGTWVEQGRAHAKLSVWLARIVGLSILGVILGCFYYGWVFVIQDYPRNQNLFGSLLLLLVFFPAVTALGCLLGVLFKVRERAMQILVASSIPILFLSGVTWPVTMLPEPLQYVRWLLPSTAGMNASVMLNQMGSSLADVQHYLLALLLLFLLSVLGLFFRANEQ